MNERLRRNGWTPEQDEALRALVEAGFSRSQTAVALNARFGTAFNKNAVCGRADRLGITSPARSTKPKAKRVYKTRPRRAVIGPVLRPAPPSITEEIEPHRIALVDLLKDDCRWPIGGWPGSDPVTYCGHPKTAGSSYCPHHFRKSLRLVA